MKKLFTLLIACACLCQTKAKNLPIVTPEQAGLSSKHLCYADSAIEKAINDSIIPGAVLAVVRHGKMAYIRSYGNKRIYPEIEKMTTETIFDLASCSKAVSTAVSTLILVDEGKIRLLDPVNYYLPTFKNAVGKDGKTKLIRIINLLTHTSGLPPYAPVEELRQKYGSPCPEGLMKYINDCPRNFTPGEDMDYSCLNYITLQHIIEKVSGESLKNFANEHIFQPLGMTHTMYQPEKKFLPLIAPTEKQKDGSVLWGVVHDPLARIMNNGISGNAGVFSSAPDLGIFVAMLQNEGVWNGKRILSPLAVKAMRTVPMSLKQFGRSLGWDLYSPYASNNGDLFGPHTYGHTGYTGTSIVIDPDTDTAVILLTNAVHPIDGPHNVIRLRSLISNIVAGSIITP